MSDPDTSADDQIDLDQIAADFDRIETALNDLDVAPTIHGDRGGV